MGRKTLFFTGLVLAWLMFMSGRSHAHEVTVYEPGVAPRTIDFECPVDDGSDWSFDASKWHSVGRVEVIHATPQYFQQMCQPEVATVAACATFGSVDTVYGGYYSRIYVLAPFYSLPVSLQIHELCHTQGWVHGRHYGFDIPSFSPRR